MKTGDRWSCGRFTKACGRLVLPLLGVLTAGCAVDRAAVEKNLMAVRDSTHRYEGVAASYRVSCPDVIELEMKSRPEFAGQFEVEPDGRIDLKDYGNLRVDGRTPPEIARLVATAVGVSHEEIQVRVIEYRSAFVLLFGEVAGRQRSVPYRGPETVLDLLQRVGGITVGAEPNDVYVVRPHLGESRRPQVFHVDLQAIVVKQNHATNLRILPFDQIYVGETRQAKVEKALPPWLRSMYQAVWDTRPTPSQTEDSNSSRGRIAKQD